MDDIALGNSSFGSASNPGNISLDGHIRQIKDMADAITNNKKPLIDEHEGRKPIEIIMTIYESSRTRQIVEFY